MKLTVIQTLPALDSGGVERGTLELAAELVRCGHRAIVVSAGGRMQDELLQSGAEHITLPVGKKNIESLLSVRKLARILASSQAHILHARSRLPAWISYLAWLSMKKNSRPAFVTSVHGPYSVNRYSRIMLRGERVIAISEFIYRYIRDNYADMNMDRVTVIPRGIKPEQFPYTYRPADTWLSDWQKNYPQLQGRFVITLPARITRWKGQEDFIHIIAALLKANINVHGLVVGGTDPRRRSFLAELESLVSTSGLQQHITFTGHRDDIREIMSVSDLIMSLSTEPEAFGRTSMEALGLGKPVIAYDHGGASEVLNKIFPLGLVRAMDKQAATDKAMAFYASPPSVADNKPFTLQKMLDQTINLYQALAQRKCS